MPYLIDISNKLHQKLLKIKYVVLFRVLSPLVQRNIYYETQNHAAIGV